LLVTIYVYFFWRIFVIMLAHLQTLTHLEDNFDP